MLIMINGPFGVGKTSAAAALNDRLDDFMIFDPEEVGFMLRNIVTDDIKYPSEKTGDFQDIILWKELIVHIAARLTAVYKKNLIIPMTIYKTEYLECVINELKKIDSVKNFCLIAHKNTIEKRLLVRGEEPGTWAFNQIEKCLNAFESNAYMFDEILYTDSLSVSEICDRILKSAFK